MGCIPLSVKPKTIKLLKEHIEDHLLSWVRHYFLDRTPKTLSLKKSIMGLHKSLNICSLKAVVKRIRR